MPYNTRRKSLSLPSLGIHLPASSRRSPSISSKSQSQSQSHTLAHTHDDQPSKKVKRSHDSASISPEPQHFQHHRPAARRAAWEHTPPPSPSTDGPSTTTTTTKIDTEGINDDIVVAVIRQLEATHNRPHLVKELAAVLVARNDTVANSANPAALLSSRLSSYMKRSWSALAPCPIGKELILIHPRKVYYYLTTIARQPLPENSDDLLLPSHTHLTPTASSVDDNDEADRGLSQEEEDSEDDWACRHRSSSPEVDLSSPDFEDDGAPRAPSHGFDDPHATSMRLMHAHRAVSPPLEGDEKEFTQTASAVRERASEQKASQRELSSARSAISEGLSQLDMADSASSAASASRASSTGTSTGTSSTGSYGYGYFAQHDDHDHHMLVDHDDHQTKLHEQLVEQDSDAAACALLGTSPSPSLTSVASSLSSSAPSVAGLDADDHQRAPRISLPEDPSVTHVSPLKRSIDMLNSGLSDDVDIRMADLADHEDKVAIKTPTGPSSSSSSSSLASANMHLDHTYDASWRELQNPETVEVDELDEMFGEI